MTSQGELSADESFLETVARTGIGNPANSTRVFTRFPPILTGGKLVENWWKTGVVLIPS